VPLKGFRCPPWVTTAGQANELEYCIQGGCPAPCVAPPLLQAIYRSDRDNYHQGQYISASMLAGTNCPRQTVLERSQEFYSEPLKKWWSFRGTHAHSIIEGATEDLLQHGWLQEIRCAVELPYPELPAPKFDAEGKFTGDFDFDRPLVVTVRGTCDAYHPARRELWDFKSAADAKAEMMVTGSKPGTYSPNLDDNWVRQTNIYRWLLAQTRVPDDIKTSHGIDSEFFPAPEFIGIQALSMMQLPRTGARYGIKRGKAGMEIFEIDPVPVWSLEATETFVRERALEWYRYLVLGVYPPVVGNDRAWMCQGCAFNGEKYPEGVCFPTKERKTQKAAVSYFEIVD
jgi:hypothetical protein